MNSVFILKIEFAGYGYDDTIQNRLYCFDNITEVSDKIEYIKKKNFIYNAVIYALKFNGKKLEHVFTLQDSDILIN